MEHRIRRTGFLQFGTVLLVVSVVVMMVTIGLVYKSSLDTEKAHLSELVKNQARFIDAVVQRNALKHPHQDRALLLPQIAGVLGRQHDFGKTGEFVVGRRDGDRIVFLTAPRHLDQGIPPVPVASDIAEAMRRALAGKSGMVTGLDYRSATVIAGHEPIPSLGLGLVAKIDLQEARAPFIKAILIASGVALGAIFLGVLLLRQIERQALKMTVPGKHIKDVVVISVQERFVYFVLIMSAVVSIIMVTTVLLLYFSSFKSAQSYLLEMVKSQAVLMNVATELDTLDGGTQSTLQGLVDDLDGRNGFGQTGEFVVGKRSEDDIVFLTKSRHFAHAIPPINMMTLDAKPMQQALMGKQGVLTGADYRSVDVLAAFTNVTKLDVGLVAKLDQAEIRSPFVHASLVSAGIAFVLISLGGIVLVRRKEVAEIGDEGRDNQETVSKVQNRYVSKLYEMGLPPFLVFFVCSLMVAVFALDVVTPLGVAGGMPYVLVVLAGWWFPSRKPVFILALCCSLLTVFGALGAPNGDTLEIAFVNRTYAIIVIWCVAIIVSLGKASELARIQQTDELTKLSLAVQHSPSSVIMTDVNGKIEYVNTRFENVTGYDCEEVLGQDMRLLQSGQTPQEVYKDLWAKILSGQEWTGEILNKKKDGSFYWASLSILPLKSAHNEITRFIALYEDVTERKRVREQLRHMANHDSLTGLPTRRLGIERISSAVAQARREKTKAAVLFIDLDGFKAVNDTLGHEAGDKVLIDVAKRLTGAVREVDTVARIGGDEFMAVLVGVHGQKDVETVAAKLNEVVSKPYDLGKETAMIGASIGIALYPDHGNDPEVLLKCADGAMYGVKKGGKNAFSFAQG